MCVVALKWTFVEIVIKFRIFCCKSQSHKENENPLKPEKTYIYTKLYVFFGNLFYYLLCRFYSLVERTKRIEREEGNEMANITVNSNGAVYCFCYKNTWISSWFLQPLNSVCWRIYIKFKVCDWKMPGISLALSVSRVDLYICIFDKPGSSTWKCLIHRPQCREQLKLFCTYEIYTHGSSSDWIIGCKVFFFYSSFSTIHNSCVICCDKWRLPFYWLPTYASNATAENEKRADYSTQPQSLANNYCNASASGK